MRPAAVILVAVLSLSCTRAPAHKAAVLTDANFEELTANGVSLVDFWAVWCPPCRQQGPIVEKVAEAFEGRALVGKLDENPETAGEFQVRSIPTLVVLRDGEEQKRFVGLQSEEALSRALEEALSR